VGVFRFLNCFSVAQNDELYIVSPTLRAELSMKRSLMCFLLIIHSATAVSHAPHIISMGTKQHWVPYHIDLKDGVDGLAVRALACIMARINQPYVIHKLPWARAQAIVDPEIGTVS